MDYTTQLTTDCSQSGMKITITRHFTNQGNPYYRWEMWEGPDGIEHVQGFAIDLIQTFSKIVEWQERIGHEYFSETNENETYGNRAENVQG